MPNPGAFKGSRKEFLLGEKAAYALGVAGGYAPEALAVIQRRFFKRFPPELPDDEEPSAEYLAAVDDDAPDPEVTLPVEELMSAEEYAAAMSALEARRKTVVFKKAQIKRWMIYQYVKDHDVNPTKPTTNNPYQNLTAKITGTDTARPRMKTAVNHWRKEHKTEIEEEAKIITEKAGLQKSDQAALRDRIARDMFSKLPEEEQEHWKEVALAEHAVVLDQWKRDVQQGASTDPADRQRAIQGLVHFVQPILDAICEATGWKVTLIAGGPEPAQDGRLNVVSIHSGTTTGDVKMTFGRSERVDIKKYIIPIFGKFLQKCYSPEECRSRALPQNINLSPIATSEDFNNEDAVLHTLSQASTGNTADVSTQGSNPGLQSNPTHNASLPSTISHSIIVTDAPPLSQQPPIANRSLSPDNNDTDTDNPFPVNVLSLLDAADPSAPLSLSPIPAPTLPHPCLPTSRPVSPVPSPPASRPVSPVPSCPHSPATAPSGLHPHASRLPVLPPLVAPVSIAPTVVPPPTAETPIAHGPLFNTDELSNALAASRRFTLGVWNIVRNGILSPPEMLPSLDSVESVLRLPSVSRENAPAVQPSDISTLTTPAPPTQSTEVPKKPDARRSGRLAAKANELTPVTNQGASRKRGRKTLANVLPAVEHVEPPLKRLRRGNASNNIPPSTSDAVVRRSSKRK